MTKATITTIDGKDMTFAEISRLYKVPRSTIQHRYTNGLRGKKLIYGSGRTKLVTFSHKENQYTLNSYDLKIMKENSVTIDLLKKRLDENWDLKNALAAPKGMNRNEFININQLSKYENYRDDLLKQKRLAKRKSKIIKSRELVKKYRVSSRWFEYLVENNLVAKLKTDSYGKVQRG